MIFPRKNDDYLKSLLKKNENEELDFKLNISDSFKIAKTLVSFANTKGGIVAIGINDQKIVKGIDPEEELFMIEKATNQHCTPPVLFDIEVYEIDYLNDEKLDESLYVLLIKVEKSENIHFVRSKEGEKIKYIRIGDSNIPDVSEE